MPRNNKLETCQAYSGAPFRCPSWSLSFSSTCCSGTHLFYHLDKYLLHSLCKDLISLFFVHFHVAFGVKGSFVCNVLKDIISGLPGLLGFSCWPECTLCSEAVPEPTIRPTETGPSTTGSETQDHQLGPVVLCLTIFWKLQGHAEWPSGQSLKAQPIQTVWTRKLH